MLRSGRLNKPGVLYSVTQTYTDAGDETEVETRLCDAWARPVSAYGREFEAARQMSSDVTHVWQMRYVEDLTPDDIWKHDDRTFRILSVINEAERGESMLVTTVEVV